MSRSLEQKAKATAYMKVWYAANRQRILVERNRKYAERHPPRTDVLRGRARMQKYRAKRMAEVSALKAGPCMDCGGRFPPECMDFDHVRGEKRRSISKGSWNMSALQEELAKCELVCANCHRIRTRARNQVGRVA